MSQKELAEKCGVSQTVISILETCDIEPGAGLLSSIHKALGAEYQDEKKGEKKMTQNQRVLNYMMEHGEISQRDAVKFGCYRLSARIHDLREMKYSIVTENRGFRNEYGSGYYAVYRLAGGQP